jgi:phage-related protein
MPSLEKFAGKVGDKMGKAIEKIAAKLPDIAKGFKTLLTVINPVGAVLVEVFKRAWPAIQKVVERFLEWLQGPQGGAIIDGVLAAAGKAAEVLVAVFQKVWPILQDVVSRFLDWLRSPAGAAMIDSIFNAIGAVLGALKMVFEAVWPVLQQIVQTFVNFLGSENGQKLIKTLFDGIGTVVKALQTVFETVWPIIEGVVKHFLDWFNSESGQKTIKTLVDAIGTAMGAVQTIWEAAWPAIQEALKIAGPIIKLMCQGITIAVQAIGWAIEKVLKLFEILEKKRPPKSSIPGGYNNPYLNPPGGVQGAAWGDVVTSPRLTWVGEAGPEAIIPLSADKSQRRDQLMAESGLSNGSATIDAESMEQLAAAIAGALATEYRRQQRLARSA